MTTRDEQRYYEACAVELAAQEGAVVDLGCWMGSTSLSLARGLRKGTGATRPASASAKVQAIDRFLWEPWMDPFLPRLSREYRDGDSFLPEARERLGELRHWVELIEADLTTYRWQQGRIRILLVDAMKSRELVAAIAEQFFPQLVPGSLVLHQDFKHYYTPWLHLFQYRLRDHFRFVHEVVDGGTVSFRTIRPVSVESARSAAALGGVSDDEVTAAFDYSLELVGDAGRSAVAAAHVMHYVHARRLEEARRVRDAYAHRAHPPEGDFALAVACLNRLAAEQAEADQ